MKLVDGDRVIGVPEAARMRKKHPTVVGEYEKVTVKHGGNVFDQEFIVVNDEISVVCRDIKPANRRDKETVL